MAIFRDNTINPVEHDRSIEDRRRHRQLVEKSIKENLGDILSEESIVGETKNKKFKIPIRGIKELNSIYSRMMEEPQICWDTINKTYQPIKHDCMS